MADSFEKLRTRQLEGTFECLRPLVAVESPPKGWLRAIREALGMTMSQMAEFLDVTKSMISKYEKAEVHGTIQLATLRKVASALDSEVVYAVVPRHPIDEMRTARARTVARRHIDAVHQSMTLEDQATSEEERERQITELTEELLEEQSRRLWDEV